MPLHAFILFPFILKPRKREMKVDTINHMYNFWAIFWNSSVLRLTSPNLRAIYNLMVGCKVTSALLRPLKYLRLYFGAHL